LHQAPAWPEPRVHHFLAAGCVLHQQAQELAVPLDDTQVRDTGFVAGCGVFQVCDDPPYGVEGGGDLPLPHNGTWKGCGEDGEAVDRVEIGERYGIVHDSHISRNAALARCKRDFTVPAGIPKVVAISCSLRPSRVRKTRTARWEGGSRARASSMSHPCPARARPHPDRRRLRPRERKTDAERRVQRLLDQAWPGWRAAVRWRRSSMRTHCTGAIDLPGTTWRDRPAISRSNTLAVATDQSAAPGLLAEAAITAAKLAVQQLGETALTPQAQR
jgi:hypothetical protein